MLTTDAQVRKLMEEFSKHGTVGLAGLRAGMSRNTAAKYARLENAALGTARRRGHGGPGGSVRGGLAGDRGAAAGRPRSWRRRRCSSC